MSWRAFCFLAGLPVGALAILPFVEPRAPLPGLAAALAVAVTLQVAVVAVARARAGEASRAARLAAGSGAGCAAGAAATFAAGVLVALAAGSGPTHAEGRADAIYDLDAQVATRPLPVCGGEPARNELLLERGARPRLSPDATDLWFDAPDANGVRQLHRLRLADGGVACWTCGERGDNRRPRPGERGMLFETDRHASWREPVNTEIHWIAVRGDAPRHPSKRLSFAPGPDDHALFAPGGSVVWSRRSRGYEVVSAPLQRAHGGLTLGPPLPLARGGAAWLAPADWSADARALALLRGNPFAPLAASAVDFATGAMLELGTRVADDGVAFSADGGFVIVADTERGQLAGLLPAAVATPFAGFASHARAPLQQGTRLRAGPRGGPLQALDLPELERWGSPTGVTLFPDGRSAILGQRSADGSSERLVRVDLGCS